MCSLILTVLSFLKNIIFYSVIIVFALVTSCLTFVPLAGAARRVPWFVTQGGPSYFIAIHNEPAPADSVQILENFLILIKMVKQADNYNIKLTLMFTPQWVEYIVADEQRLEIVRDWADHGHEIAAHHHSIYHQAWDGFSSYDLDIVYEVRVEFDRSEPYSGTLDEYMDLLYLLNPDMKAGCVNDEDDKHAMPDGIIYDTCSGYANFGEFGQVLDDDDPEKGVNDYISVGYYKGIERRWLAHTYMGAGRLDEVADIFLSMDSGVYGVMNHSLLKEQEAYSAYLEFLHKYDPAGLKSSTVSALIDAHLLQIQYFDEDFEPYYTCGDSVCSEYEQGNADSCPLDCP